MAANNQGISAQMSNDAGNANIISHADTPDDDGDVCGESTPFLSENPVEGSSKQPSTNRVSGFGSRITSSVRSVASNSLRKASSRLLQSMSTSQREQAMALGVGPAAFLIKDAVIGQQDAPYEGWYDPYATFGHEYDELHNLISVLCGRTITSKWAKRFLCYAPNWILFILSFIEPPQWCRDSDLTIARDNPSDSLREYGDCNIILNAWGLTADGNDADQLYPNSSSMWISVTQCAQVEMACMGVVTFWMMLELGRDGMDLRLFFYNGAKKVLHSIRCCCLVALLIGQVCDRTSLNPFFRMILLASHLRSFQVELLSVARMIPQIIYILAMLGIVVIFYAWFGVVLFYDTEQGNETFPNLMEGIWTLWICITTANYPDVMMPSYNGNRLSGIFFVSFMVISFFYLMNLILAGVVNTYNENIEKRKSDRDALAIVLF